MNHKINDIDNMTVRSYGEQALRDEAQAILDQISYMDSNFEKAVDMMFHCQGKIIVTGVGKSGHVGAKIAATLASTGTPAFCKSLISRSDLNGDRAVAPGMK